MKPAKEKKPLSKGAKIALIVGGDLLLLLMGWFLLISPQRATAKSIAASVTATQLQIADAKKQAEAPATPAAVQQPEIKTANLYELAKAMPSTMDTPDLLLELNQVAREAGVTLSSIQPGQPDAAQSATGFSTVPIELSFDGDFYSLTDFIYRLRSLVTVRDGQLLTMGRLLSVDKASLSSGDTSGGSGLTASVTVNAYVYGGTPAAAPAATPAVTETSTTDTSSTTTTPAADVAPAN